MYRVSKVLNNNGVIAINMEENIDLKRRITAPGIL